MYTYAANNPLKYTDPSGYKIGILAQTASGIQDDIGPIRDVGGGSSWTRYGTLATAYTPSFEDYYSYISSIGMWVDNDNILGTFYHQAAELLVNGLISDQEFRNAFERSISNAYSLSGDNSMRLGLLSYGIDGHNFVNGLSLSIGSELHHMYFDDLRIDLESTSWSIGDLFARIRFLESQKQLDNLFDIVIPNNYSNRNIYGNYLETYFKIGGFEYKVKIKGSNDTDPPSAFKIWKHGFGHLNAANTNLPRTNMYNNGYYIGYYMWSYENDPLILIGGRNSEAKNYLRKLFYQY